MHSPRPNEGQILILHYWNQGSSLGGLVLRDNGVRLLGLYTHFRENPSFISSTSILLVLLAVFATT